MINGSRQVKKNETAARVAILWNAKRFYCLESDRCWGVRLTVKKRCFLQLGMMQVFNGTYNITSIDLENNS